MGTQKKNFKNGGILHTVGAGTGEGPSLVVLVIFGGSIVFEINCKSLISVKRFLAGP